MTQPTLAILASSNPLDHVVQHELFQVGPVLVTNHMLMLILGALLLLLIVPLIARQRSMVPSGLRNFFEAICVFLREEVARPVLGENTDRFIKFIWTTFFFILFCNLIGMVPVDGILVLASLGHLKHFGGTATSNIWVTGTLAACAFLMIHVSGIRQQGLWRYLKNFIPHVPWPLIPVMYALEFIGALVKPFALAIRLFANMMAGHTVLGALIGMGLAARSIPIAGVTVFGCAALSLLELFVAFLQAYIFTYLTTLFIGAAVHPEH
ncbi:MAG: F0F1 ATP synthase subunit A [Sedimentisphaerales bacterium]|nr:F0F1 ATP synthase subunit A [Sedimentisphaerales bacterium]